jgi:hypothetical protein
MHQRKNWRLWLGAIAMLAAQLVLMTLFVKWGTALVAAGPRLTMRFLVILGTGLLLIAAATYLLRSTTLWWQVLLWASSVGAAILAVAFFIEAFSPRWELLLPAATSLVIFAISVAARAFLEKRFTLRKRANR